MTSTVLQDLLGVHGDTKLEHVAGMTTSVCVVALPKRLDRVRLIGPEEKHATLLFLGEMSTLPNEARNELLQTLRQVSEIVAPFTERILRVERLGEDTPPALVCKLRDNRLSQIRDMLLVNHRVKDYLGNTQQYPSYTPHVTLGYPDYAQEAELRKTVDGISGITFDRIALWWGTERLEFPLLEYSRLDEDVPMEKSAAWSEEAKDVLAHITGDKTEETATFSEVVSNFLAHFGIKGMRWGVRRTDAQLAKAAKEGVTITKGEDGRITVSGGSRGSRKFVKANADKIVEDVEKKTRDELEDSFLSADAARLVKTTQKSSHEMSDAEIRTALNRAKMVREYDEIFGQDPSTAKLRAKVTRLELEKKLYEMEEAMKPPSRVERLKDFLGNAEQAYKSFTVLDKASGGKMSKKMNSYMGVKIPKAEEVKRTTGTTGSTKRKKSTAEKVYSITSL